MKKNPVDEYLEDREKRATVKYAEELEHWQQWKAAPTPENTQALLQRFEPLIGQRVRRWKAPNVSESALRANLAKQAIKAFETYDPNKAALSTHVGNTMKKSLRFVRQNQNLAYIPEAKAEKIGPINVAQDELRQQLGRDPTHTEIGEHMGMRPDLVQNIQKQQVKDIFASQFESDPVAQASSREREVLPLLRPALGVDEQAVFDYLYGQQGKPRTTSTGQIAKHLGKSPSQISRLKKRIEAEYKKYV